MIQKLKSFLFENKTAKQTIAKNTVWLSISNFGGRIIKAAIIIYGARVLGIYEWGIFSYAVTLAGFFSLFMDCGVNAILLRDSSKATDEERRTLFSTTFVLKGLLLILGMLMIIFVGPFFSTLPGAKALLPIVALILACDVFRDFFSSLIRGMEKMEWEAGIFLFTNVMIVGFGFAFLMLAPNARSFGWGYVVGDALGTILAVIVLRRYFKKLFSYFSGKLILPIFRSAWPFAITGALGLLLTNTDILIISWLRGAAQVGIYSAAIRIIQVLYLIPVIVQLSALPLFARLAKSDDNKFRMALETTIGMIFLASIPLAVGGIILGTPIMTLIYGQAFLPGAASFKILMITLLFDFPSTVISAAVFAYNHQKSLIITSVIAGVSNVALDLLLIPPFGMAGSAVATLIANILTNWYLWHMMKKLNRFEALSHLKKIIGASALMGVAAGALLLLHVNVVVNVALSSALYFLLLYIFREPLLIELKSILRGGVAAPVVLPS